VAKGIGFGCGAIFLFGALVIASLTQNYSGFLFFLAIYVLITVLTIRGSNKRKKGLSSEPGAAPELNATAAMPRTTYAPEVTKTLHNSSNDRVAKDGYLQSPLCIHSFLVNGFDSNNRVQCPCGYTFSKVELEEYQQLVQLRQDVDAKIVAITEKIRVGDYDSRTSDATAASIPVVREKPKREKPAKPKVTLSLQQWLIMGAAALVIVAGSVFVSTNIDTMQQWVFELITVGISIATAFGAIKLKTKSAILSNFLALFSSAMQLATMTIVSDQLDPSWKWPDLPATWWAFSLGAVAVFSLVLARFSKNFGWKSIAVLNITGTGLFFVMGAMREWLANTDFVYSLTLIAFTGFMVTQIVAGRYLRSLKNEISKGENAAYEKDLAEREDSALRRYSLSAVSLLVIVSVGYAVYIAGFNTELMKNMWEPWTTIVFGLIWIALAIFPKFWAADLSKESKVKPLYETIAWVIGYSATALGLSRLASSSGNSWGSLIINVLGIAALLLLPRFVAKFSPKPLALDFALWMSFVTGLIWTSSTWDWNDTFGGAYLVAYALVFTVSYWANGRAYLSIASTASANLGAIWLLVTVLNKTEGNQVVSLTALGMLAVVNLLPQIQRRVAQVADLNYAAAAQSAISIASSAGIVGIMLYRVENGIVGSIWILVTLFAYLLATLALAQRKLKANGKASVLINEIHAFIAQFGVLGIASVSFTGESRTEYLLPITWTLLALTALNYSYVLLAKRKVFLQIGYAAAIITAASALHVLGIDQPPPVLISYAVVITTTVAYLQFVASRRLTSNDDKLTYVSPIIGASALMMLGLVTAYQESGFPNKFEWPNFAVLAVGAVGALVWFELRKGTEEKLASGLSSIFAISALVQTVWSHLDLLMMDSGAYLHLMATFALVALVVVRVNHRSPSTMLMVVGFASNLATTISLGNYIRYQIPNGDVPELFALGIAAGLVGSAFLYAKQLAGHKTLVIDIAVVSALAYSAASSFRLGLDFDSAWLRGIAEFVLLTAYAYLRAMGRKSLVWLIFGYLGGAGSSLLLLNELYKRVEITWRGQEIKSAALVASILLGHYFLKKLRDVKSVDLLWGLPIAVFALPMIAQGIVVDHELLEGFIRTSLGLLILTVYAYWRTGTTKEIAWLISGYVFGAMSAFAINDGVTKYWLVDYEGPEILSALLAASVFVGHRYLRQVRKTESTLLLWGLPATALILPPALYTATTSGLNFSDLNAEQITRALAVLVASALLVLAGFRAGNRGLAYSGVLGLAIITWVHAALVVPDAVVEFRSIVIGAVLMTALTSLKNAGKLRGNSIVWLGIPIAVAMIPAIYNSLAALANPELSTVDWWRFGIVVTASAVMLIAGSLREIAGMFFPGLVGVVLAALPYGFKRVQQESWFLWVLLLMIAGIMVWIAVRMDQLRKQGKSSTTWLKELK
jgi:hypothetical protein